MFRVNVPSCVVGLVLAGRFMAAGTPPSGRARSTYDDPGPLLLRRRLRQPAADREPAVAGARRRRPGPGPDACRGPRVQPVGDHLPAPPVAAGGDGATPELPPA